MPRLKAEGELEEARMGRVKLTPEGWFDLVLEATGDRREAERAHNDAVRETYREQRERG